MKKEKIMRDLANHRKWELANIRAITFKLNRTNEKDVIEYLESLPNIRKYLIDLIRKDMNEQTTESDKG